MAVRDGIFTSEAVSDGHPDKLCDQISDAFLDAFLERDPEARVACETMAADGKIVVAGEFRTRERRHFEEVRDGADALVRDVLREAGYGSAERDIDPDSCAVEVRFNHQSPEIAGGVDRPGTLGAGDQGLMFGYATDETEALMPLPWFLANELVAVTSELRRSGGTPLRPDGKSQVSVRYVSGQPSEVEAVVLSWQHGEDVDLADVRDLLEERVADRVVPPAMRSEAFRCLINPAGSWTIGGPKGDTGLTGRKIIVDTYGAACPHGGGAFSGKDPSKVDRSGGYAARWIAKNVVAARLARRCTVQLSYAIGVAEPISVYVDTHGTGRVEDAQLGHAVRDVFDLTPSGIIRDLQLARPIYRETATFGHFGGRRDPSVYLWENPSRVGALRRLASSEDDRAAVDPEVRR